MFLSFVKSIVSKRKSNNADISSNDWLNHFESWLNSESVINQGYFQYITDDFNLHNVECNYCIENVPNDLNAPFTFEEVSNYISKLPNGKVAGHDGWVNEMLECSKYYGLIFSCVIQ